MHYIIKEDRTEYRSEEGKILALQTFSEAGDGIAEIDHTEVDSSLKGQGIAGKITELTVVYLKNQGKKIIPSCSYVKSWFEGKAEYQELLEKTE